jgi:hypothetical protein
VRRTTLLLQFHAALGERQRLVVAVLHQRHVGLVAADRREDVPRLDEQCQPFRLCESRHRLVQTAFLRERDARERMHHGQVPAVANGVKRRSRLGQVFPDDAGVADLPVAEPQLEMREADSPGIVSLFRRAQCFRQERDAAGRLAACRREAAMQAPEVREPRGIEAFARFGWTPERLGRLSNVVLKKPRVS